MWRKFYDYLNQDNNGAGFCSPHDLDAVRTGDLAAADDEPSSKTACCWCRRSTSFAAFGREIDSGAMWKNAVATVTAVGTSFPRRRGDRCPDRPRAGVEPGSCR